MFHLNISDEMHVLWAASRIVEKNIQALAKERHHMIPREELRGKKRTLELCQSPNPDPSQTELPQTVCSSSPPVPSPPKTTVSPSSPPSHVTPSVSTSTLLGTPVCFGTSQLLSPVSTIMQPSPSSSSLPQVMTPISSPSLLAPSLTPNTSLVSAAASPPTPVCSSFPNLLSPISRSESFFATAFSGAQRAMPIFSTVSIPAPVFPNPRQVLPPISTPHNSASNVTNLLPLCSTSAPFPSSLCSDAPRVLLPIFTSGPSTTPVWSSVPYGLPPVSANVCLIPPCSTTSPSITSPSQLDNLLEMHFSPEPSPSSTPDVADFFVTPPVLNNPSTPQQISQIHQNSILHTQLLNRIIELLSGTQFSTSEPEATPRPNNGATAQEINISDEQIRELKNAATSSVNFSVKLVKFIFKEEELQNRNVNGGHGRWALNPEKLLKVKEVYFKVYPSKDEATEWKQCVHAINSHLRKYQNRK